MFTISLLIVSKWYENYFSTYVERDIRLLLNVRNLRTFEHFLTLCAAQSGQLMNYTTLSNALGISVPTVKQWISVLETSGIIFILRPYFENIAKRIVKTPKLYFADPGLLCFLLSIRTIDHLKTHPLVGSIFESFIISECYKRFYNIGETPPLFFYRDQSGNEIDLLINRARECFPIEVKMSQTFSPDFKRIIEQWFEWTKSKKHEGSVLYCGEHAHQTHTNIPTVPWWVM